MFTITRSHERDITAIVMASSQLWPVLSDTLVIIHITSTDYDCLSVNEVTLKDTVKSTTTKTITKHDKARAMCLFLGTSCITGFP